MRAIAADRAVAAVGSRTEVESDDRPDGKGEDGGSMRREPTVLAASLPPDLRGPAIDREHLLDRLENFRIILPAFAQELASARRQTAALRIENRGLTEELCRLREQRGESRSSVDKHR
jgi:hypothetical protein